MSFNRKGGASSSLPRPISLLEKKSSTGSRLRNTTTHSSPAQSPAQSPEKPPLSDSFSDNSITIPDNEDADAAVILQKVLKAQQNDQSTAESLQISLTLAATVGQQLLTKNTTLQQTLLAEQQAKAALERQIEELKKVVQVEHTGRVEAGLEVLRKDEQLLELRKDVGRAGDVKNEADNLRMRIEHLDSTRSQIDKILQMTNKELRTVVGERHVLQLTVQELYDQLGNFMEINNSLKKSCQKQVSEYKSMIADMQLEKKNLSEQLTKEMQKIKNLSSKDSATIDSLTSTIKSVMNQEQTSVFAHIQQQNIADTIALQSTLENVEAEKKELLEIIARQQDTIKAMEEDVIHLEARLSDKDRTALSRDLVHTKDLSSLRSSLSNANLAATNSKRDHDAYTATPSPRLDAEFDGDDNASNEMLHFLVQGKSHTAIIEKEILEADDELDKFTRKLSVYDAAPENRSVRESASSPSQHATSQYVSVENIPAVKPRGPVGGSVLATASNRSSQIENMNSMQPPVVPVKDEGKKKGERDSQFLANGDLSVDGMSRQSTTILRSDREREAADRFQQELEVFLQVATEENKRLAKAIKKKDSALVSKQVELDNLQDMLDQSKNQVEQLKAASLDVVIADLEEQVKKSINSQNELGQSLVKTKEELMKTTAKLAERELEILAKDEIMNDAKLKNESLAISTELIRALKENAKLIQGNLELGSQLSKTASDRSAGIWELRDVCAERDKLRLRVSDLETQVRESKRQAFKDSNYLDQRHWATQTIDEVTEDHTIKNIALIDEIQSLQLKMAGQEKLIETLRNDLDQCRRDAMEKSTDSNILRSQLFGITKEREEMSNSVDQFLFGSGDKLDSTSTTMKVALFEARKMNTELSEKLQRAERNAAVQAESLSNMGSQLAQQTTKLGEVEWKLKQKEAEKEAATLRIAALEQELNEVLNGKQEPADGADDVDKAEGVEGKQVERKTSNKVQLRPITELQIEIKELTFKNEALHLEVEDLKLKLQNNQHTTASANNDGVAVQVEDMSETNCAKCKSLSSQLKNTMSRLELELSKTQTALSARLSSEQEKSTLSQQVIELQKKLNAALDETDFVKQQTEERLKSYNEMKKLIQIDKEMSNRPLRLSTDLASSTVPTIAIESLHGSGIVSGGGGHEANKSFETSINALSSLKEANAEVYTSTEALSTYLARTTNIQLQLEASLRETASAQEKLRKLEMKLKVAEDEANELKASEQRTSNQLTSQTQERSDLANKLLYLQKEISDHIMAKSAMEAELMTLKAVPERRGFFKSSKNSAAGQSPTGKFFGRGRASSASPDASSPTSPIGMIENKIMEERDKLARDLTEKSTEIAKLTKEISDINKELAKSQQEVRASAEKTAILTREHEEAIKGLEMSHAEVEECLQHQIQELADQLMEPKPYHELTLERSKTERSKVEDANLVALKAEQSKLRALQVTLKESEKQAEELKLKVEKLENELAQIQVKHELELLATKQEGEVSEVRLETSDCTQKEILDLHQTISSQKAEINRLKAGAQKSNVNDEQIIELQKLIDGQKLEIVRLKSLYNATGSNDGDAVNVDAISELKNQVARLETQLDASNASSLIANQKSATEVTMLKNEIENLTQLKDNLQSQANQTESKLFDINNQLTAKSEAYNLLVEEKTQLSNRLDTTMWKMQTVQEKCAAAEAKLSMLEAKQMRQSIKGGSGGEECEGCVQLGNSMKQLNTELIDWQSRCDKASMDLTNIEWQKYALEAKLKAAEGEMRQLKQWKQESDNTAAELKDQIADLKSKHRTEVSELDSMKLSSESRINSLEKERKEAEKAMNHAIDTYNQLRVESEEQAALSAGALERQRVAYEQEIQNLSQKVIELESTLKSTKEEMDLYINQVSSANKASENETITNLQQLLEDLQSKLESKDILVDQYIESSASLRSQIMELTSQVSELEETIRSHKDLVQELKAELEATKEKSKDQIRETIAHSTSLMGNISDLEATIVQLESKRDQLEVELAAEKSNQDSRASLSAENEKELRTELEMSKLRVMEQAKIAIIRQTTLQAKDQKIAELESNIVSLQNEASSVRKELQTASEQLLKAKARIDELIKLSVVRTTKLKGKEEWITELELEVARLRAEVQNLKNNSGDSTSKDAESTRIEKSDPSSELGKAKARIDELIKLSIVRTTNLKGREEKIDELEMEVVDLKARLEVATSQSEDFATMRAALEKAKAKIDEMSKTSRANSNSLKEKEARIQELEAEIEALRTETAAAASSSMKEQLSRSQARVKELERKVKDLDNQVMDLNEKVHTREEEILEVRKWLRESEAELSKVEADRKSELRHRGLSVATNPQPTAQAVSPASTTSTPSTAVDSTPFQKGVKSGTHNIQKNVYNFLCRIYWLNIAIVFVILIPVCVFNITNIEIPQVWRLMAQIVCGISAFGLISRPKEASLQFLK